MPKIAKISKRQSTKHKVKVEKKIREHKRKIRKEAKKNPKKKGNPKRHDPGVPRDLPFKEDIIKEAQAYKQKIEIEREKKRAQQKKARDKLKNQNRNLGDIMKDAEKQQAAYDRKMESEQMGETQASSNLKLNRSTENSRKTFYKEFSKVVESADVVLEVLDARDPLGSRCVEMEDAIRASNGAKKLILVLNKIDLVPKENVEAWLKHLRMELPTVAFKASTQEQQKRLTQTSVDYILATEGLVQSKNCLGADVLMKLLKNYCRETEMHINVGVVGYPNTGKSSIINSLKRKQVCDSGSVPGITKAMQTVLLDKQIRLLDSPGVVLNTSGSDTAAVLRNVVRVEAVDDPVPCVEAILSRCQKVQMMLQYNIKDYKDTTDFLVNLAVRQGKMKKGGIPDCMRAAKALLQDWNSGKITYYTAPPEKTDAGDKSVHVGATIVSGFSKEFNIDDIMEAEANMLKDLPSTGATHMLVSGMDRLSAVQSEADLEKVDEDMAAADDDDDDEDGDNEAMEEDGDAASSDAGELKGVSVVAKAKGNKKSSQQPTTLSAPVDFRHKNPRHKNPKERKPLKTVGGLYTKQDRNQLLKKDKKKKKRANALAGKLSDAMETALAGL